MSKRPGSAVTSGPIVAAMKAVDVSVGDIDGLNLFRREPGIEGNCTPSLGAHADDCIALLDQPVTNVGR